MALAKLTKLSKWSDHARNFHDFLGDVLEGEREIVSHPTPAPAAGRADAHFDVRNDIENALLVPSRGRGVIKFETIFDSLAPFFEAGFMFEQTELDEPRLRSMFLFGRTYKPSAAEAKTALELPAPGFPGVLRGRIGPLLSAYRLQGLRSLADASVFAVSVRRGVVVLLVCNRPHPWQVGMMEKAFHHLSQGQAK